ncbi:hypothetical protein SP21_84 [Salmonella phage 21]|nr:hypothetical protein SP21_84 [Salmonella phage 21]
MFLCTIRRLQKKVVYEVTFSVDPSEIFQKWNLFQAMVKCLRYCEIPV